MSIINASSLFTSPLRQTFRLQNTIAHQTTLSGFGFWTGDDVHLQFHPAKPNTGVVFVRTDLPGMPQIPARVEFREEKPRQSSLVNGSARVDMVEHVLAAVKALHIDNCEIWTDRPEMPGLDGSSQLFFERLEQAGVIQQPAIRKVRLVVQAFRVGDGKHQIDAVPSRGGVNSYQFTLVPEVGYPLHEQCCQFNLTPENFRSELMSCRTFLAKHEADYLQQQGLCHRVTPKDVLVLTEQGPLDNEFRFADECARHKVLDMVGDFSLTDCDWIGTFESYRGGHSLNAECVKQLQENTMLLDESFISSRSNLIRSQQELLDAA